MASLPPQPQMLPLDLQVAKRLVSAVLALGNRLTKAGGIMDDKTVEVFEAARALHGSVALAEFDALAPPRQLKGPALAATLVSSVARAESASDVLAALPEVEAVPEVAQ